MTEYSLLDMYDLAREGETKTTYMTENDVYVTVAAIDGIVAIRPAEDGSWEREFDPRDLDADEFVHEVDAFLTEYKTA